MNINVFRKACRALCHMCPVLLIVISATACFETRVVLRPVKSERPVHMFGSYEVDLRGLGEEPFGLVCDLSYLSGDHEMADIDSIPIFILDSICFYGACIAETRCYSEESSRDGVPILRRLGNQLDDIPAQHQDVFVVSGKVIPRGYGAVHVVPPECHERQLSVCIHARLVERRSLKTISSESKWIRLEIKSTTRPTLG